MHLIISIQLHDRLGLISGMGIWWHGSWNIYTHIERERERERERCDWRRIHGNQWDKETIGGSVKGSSQFG